MSKYVCERLREECPADCPKRILNGDGYTTEGGKIPFNYCPIDLTYHPRCIPYKEEKMKWRLKDPEKTISLCAMIAAGAQETCQDFMAFAMKATKAGYLWHMPIPVEKAQEWARTNFLIDRGFVEEGQPSLSLVMIEEDDQYAIKVDNNEYWPFVLAILKNGSGVRLYPNQYQGNGPKFETEKGRIKIVD